MIDLILGALCEVRSDAHIESHGGLAADSAWHVANGELPTCDPEGAVKAPGRAVDRSFDSERWGDGSKSRFCRKKWFC